MFNLSKLSFEKKESLLINSNFNRFKMKIFDDIIFVFKEKYYSYCIGEDDAIEGLQNFIFGLTRSFEKKRPLAAHCICQSNVGLHAVKEFVEIILNESASANEYILCPHQKYKIFGYKNKRVSWLYNDQYENIVLEVTPWFDVRKAKNKKLYERWIEHYKPILKRTIAPEIAQKWIQQMETLLRTVRANSGLDLEYDFMEHREKE